MQADRFTAPPWLRRGELRLDRGELTCQIGIEVALMCDLAMPGTDHLAGPDLEFAGGVLVGRA